MDDNWSQVASSYIVIAKCLAYQADTSMFVRTVLGTYGNIPFDKVTAPSEKGLRNDRLSTQRPTPLPRRQRTMVTGRSFRASISVNVHVRDTLPIQPQLLHSLKGMYASTFLFPPVIPT
jgi:hypothetical protein